MGLIANCFRYQWHGLAEASAHALLPGSWDSDHQWQKRIALDGESAVRQTMASPPGHYLPHVWHAPIVVGEMSMRVDAEGDLAGDLIPSYPMSVDFTGAGDLTATAALAIAMAIAMTGSGTLTATIEGRLNASVDMTGSGDLTAAIEGIGNMAVAMLGVGDLEATIAAYGNMAVDIVVTGTGLTIENVASAVWDEVLADHLTAGTTGAALNGAGSAGDPWGTALPGAYGAGSAGKLIGDLLASGSVDGLDVLEALRVGLAVLAGKTSGFAAGAGTRTVRSVDDTKDRLVAVQDASANRTSTTLDGS